jgi:flagellar M-ring protein FliF
MNYLSSFILWFKQLSIKQKISLSLITAFIVLLTLSLSLWVLSPSYAVLFTQLDEQDANQIVTQLESSEIPYQLRHEGLI